MSEVAKIFSAELEGINAKIIEVEVDVSAGLHSFSIVGLADKALSEAKERVNSALKNIGVKPPNRENRRITVNLAPADIKKTGSQYDLAIALGYLLATGQIKKFNSADKIFIGELSLNGDLRPVFGSLNIAEMAKKLGFHTLFLPEENAKEAGLTSGLNIIPISDLKELIEIIEERKEKSPASFSFSPAENFSFVSIAEVKGQENAKRALSIAAAGAHNILMSGPPGSGKSMLAQALVSILPPLEFEEAIESTKIYSVAGQNKENIIRSRPFRSPHHTASSVSIIGGGQTPKPGEISLAHRGVLFLDEVPEFHRDVLEALRQPLENGKIFISRARGVLEFPAKFMLVAAMNPCPCGFWNDPEKECHCTANEIFRYQKKISGPLLDRIDIQITVPRAKTEELMEKKIFENEKKQAQEIKERVALAREKQKDRFKKLNLKILVNSELSSHECDDIISLNEDCQNFLKKTLEKSLISARGYYRTLKVARTIADLESSENVLLPHLAEAFRYRLKD